MNEKSLEEQLAATKAELERMRANYSAQVDDTLSVIKSLGRTEARAEKAEKQIVELERERGEMNAGLREEIEEAKKLHVSTDSLDCQWCRHTRACTDIAPCRKHRDEFRHQAKLHRVAEAAWNRGYSRGYNWEFGQREGDIEAIIKADK